MTSAAQDNQPSRGDRWLHAWLLAAAAAGLGAAIQVRDGLYDPRGFIGLTIALVAGLLIYLLPRIASIEQLGPKPAPLIFGSAIALNFIQLLSNNHPGSWHAYDAGLLRATPFYYVCLTAAALICAAMVLRPRLARPLLLLLVVIFCIIGAWVIRAVPQPHMDVWLAQTEGIKALLHGRNPFTTTFPDIYNRPELYAPGVLHDGLVHLGFPYPPMVLWMDLPGYLIGGDYRWSNLAAMALAALLIAFARPGRLGPLAAATMLFTPRAFFVLESGWTEPATILLLAAVIFCACRYAKLTPIFLGLFLASKQYLLWAIAPLVLLAGWPPRWPKLLRLLLIALAVGCAVSLPLILWDVHGFVRANFDIARGTGFRGDALSYLALWANVTGRIPSAPTATTIGFIAAALATVLVTLRGARTPAGYAAALAVAHLCFFASYKFAFCNYYSFLIGAFCCAAGALDPGGRHYKSVGRE